LDKWEQHILFDMLYLGFWICSRTMHVTWPEYKQTELYDEIRAALALQQPSLTPQDVAYMVGKL
jgi:hypothetical protein